MECRAWIRRTNTLCYYDGHQIFEACDNLGQHYLALMVASDQCTNRYVVVGIDPDTFRRSRNGWIDLRSLMIGAAANGWYIGTMAPDLDELLIRRQDGLITESTYLPDAGFFLQSE